MTADIIPYHVFLGRRIQQERQRLNTAGPGMSNPQRTRQIQHIINLETRFRMASQLGAWWSDPALTGNSPIGDG